MSSRKQFIKHVTVAATGTLMLPRFRLFAEGSTKTYEVPVPLRQEMYEKALALAIKNIRGGSGDPVYKKPFVDAAFSGNIFLWDTCFMACFCKYHQQELPIANALDNFYDRQEANGFISREYTKKGVSMWPKEHPVSINPPLLAFAELELHSVSGNAERLRKVYPALRKYFDYLVGYCRMEDHLFFSDAFGSGMDNIPRYPDNWNDDGKGIPMRNLFPDIYAYEGLSPHWNIQGRSVDMSAQMALFAENMISIGKIIGLKKEIPYFQSFYDETKKAINDLCWNDEDGFYYDLGYGKQIPRKHIGMFWTLMSGVVPPDKLERLLAHLTDPAQFWRTIPAASYPADQKEFSTEGSYWLGSVWAPTNYAIIRGLHRYQKKELAAKLAKQYYWCVAQVFERTKTFWENYAPDQLTKGNWARPDFCGWTAIVPITLLRELIQV